MAATLDLTGLNLTIDRLKKLQTLDATDLMVSWMKIIDADNRRGILQGLDKDGVPMVPVTYRPKKPGPIRPTSAQRGGKSSRARKGGFIELGAAHGNLSSAEYRLLGGPPLAPRDQFSRVITNFSVDFTGPPEGFPVWQVIGWWEDVVNSKGENFLRYHFHSVPSKLPKRDLRGIRPQGITEAREATQNWIRDKIRGLFG